MGSTCKPRENKAEAEGIQSFSLVPQRNWKQGLGEDGPMYQQSAG